jgi:hypothetical protein
MLGAALERIVVRHIVEEGWSVPTQAQVSQKSYREMATTGFSEIEWRQCFHYSLGGLGPKFKQRRLISSSRLKENGIAFCSTQPQSLPVSIHRCVYSACAESWLM